MESALLISFVISGLMAKVAKRKTKKAKATLFVIEECLNMLLLRQTEKKETIKRSKLAKISLKAGLSESQAISGEFCLLLMINRD